MLWNIAAGRSSTSLAFAGRLATHRSAREMRLHRGPLVVEDRAEEDARR